jgi:hypothetical protein
MTHPVALPCWLVLLLAALAAWAALEHLLLPALRWALHRRAEAACESSALGFNWKSRRLSWRGAR